VVDQLLTLRQVAAYLNVSPRAVLRLVARRSLPCHQFGRVARSNECNIFRWLAGPITNPHPPDGRDGPLRDQQREGRVPGPRDH